MEEKARLFERKTEVKWHFIGIGGIGMSALARLLLEQRCAVSGSDQKKNTLACALEEMGATIYEGHDPEKVQSDQIVVYSSGVPLHHPERIRAEKNKCTILHRAELLAYLAKEKKSLFIAGTHGKTTTSALLTHVLLEAGKDPSYAIGGLLYPQKCNAKTGKGPFFVAEADESDGSLIQYQPSGAIVTNLTDDHLASYGGIENLHGAFQTFLSNVQRIDYLFWCADDPTLVSLKPPGTSYGFCPQADAQIIDFQQKGGKLQFSLRTKELCWKDIILPRFGRHQAQNAAGVFLLALRLGVPEEVICKSFLSFQGIARRSEILVEEPVLVIDDYAHHPNEIRATLASVRQAFAYRRIFAVFQPHRPSRTRQFLQEFALSFADADTVFVTPIDPSSEKEPIEVLGKSLEQQFAKHCLSPFLFVSLEDIHSTLFAQIRQGDIVLFLGAGSITEAAHTFVQELSRQSIKKWKVALFCGGQSIEHPISLTTARYLMQALSSTRNEVEVIGVTKEGSWCAEESIFSGGSRRDNARIPRDLFESFLASDICIPAFHGPLGEDGSIQGMCEFLGRPFIGCGSQAASIAMNKSLCKQFAEREGIPTLPFLSFHFQEWQKEPLQIAHKIRQKFTLPVFVKPVHLGSSCGISRVDTWEEIMAAIQHAFRWDGIILVEQGIVARELEFAVLGDLSEADVFGPGEALTGGQFYHFGVKYGQNAMKADPKPSISDKIVDLGKDYARRIYAAIGGEGFARVDFFLDTEGMLWFSEINPFPGLTPTSLYPKLVEQEGIDPSALLTRLLYFAWKRGSRHREYTLRQHREIDNEISATC